MDDYSIEISHVSKIYKLYDKPIDRLKETFMFASKNYHKDFYALKDVSFYVEKGECIGIIGENGAGKSTLLKILTGVLSQTKGEIKINGKIAALLELGAGFNSEYTGIENIYLNGTLMGYTEKEMKQKVEQIVEFADIGDFIHQPVKSYSSGMFVRLAFSTQIFSEPDVLIVDEALSVGDAFFQAKCFNRLEEVMKSGTTILFVSHDMISVKKLCSRVVWMQHGEVLEIGESKAVCEKYIGQRIEKMNEQNRLLVQQMNLESAEAEYYHGKAKKIWNRLQLKPNTEISGSKKAELLSFSITNKKGEEINSLEAGQTYSFRLVTMFHQDIKNALFGFELENTRGVKLFSINNFLENQVLKIAEKNRIYEIVFTVPLPRICKGEYLLSTSIASGNQVNHIVHQRIHNYAIISIENEGYNLSLVELNTNVKMMQYLESDVSFV